MNLETFKRIQRQVAELEKAGLEFDVQISNDRSWAKGCSDASFDPVFYKVTKLSQLAQLQAITGTRIRMATQQMYGVPTSEIALNVEVENCTVNLSEKIRTERDLLNVRKDFPAIKFYSPSTHRHTPFTPVLIEKAPTEKTEDGITYRFLGTKDYCELCIPHTSDIYIYLDKGFCYGKIREGSRKERVVITNELTPDTYLVMYLCSLHPPFTRQLDKECFINAAKAKILRIKFEKELKPEYKNNYESLKQDLLADYEKSVNSNMINKVIRGELPIATFNRIKLTKDSANYEGVTLESPGMLPYLYERMIFDDRTDIYGIIDNFIKGKYEELEKAALEAGENEEEKSIKAEFKINGIEIAIKRSTANTRRAVNGFYINKEEITDVCYRASCFDTQEIFDKFVKSVHSMSLKWHDAIGNGIPVKIHNELKDEEYKSPTAPTTCPRIKFSKEEDHVYLITGEGENDRAPIKLNAAIKKIARLNRMTNNKYSHDYGYTPRNAAWARRQLVKILKECCTFKVKTPKVDADGKAIIVDGKRQYDVTHVCHLTEEKSAFIGKWAVEYYNKAVKRSIQFLEEAVKQTGATTIEFNGEPCWYVEGIMHKYAVSKRTNMVFNYERGNNICIVEPGHRVEVGFDATATRLLMLKNDRYRSHQVTTLQHA